MDPIRIRAPDLLRAALIATVFVFASAYNDDRVAVDPEEARKRHDAFHNKVYVACAARCGADGCAKTSTISDVDSFSPAMAVDGACRPECDARGTEAENENENENEGGGVNLGVTPRRDASFKPYTPTMPWWLRVSGWTCEEDCGYRCMRAVEEARVSQGFIPAKYHGKWSFRRVAGAQEFVSAVASVANGAVHAWHLPMLARHRRRWGSKKGLRGGARVVQGYEGVDVDGNPGSPFATLWMCNAVIHMNAWLWSTVFHARDTDVTRGMDYASANVVFFFSLFEAVTRSAGWRSPRQWGAFAALCAAGLLAHWSYMFFFNFDYTLNLYVCAACAVGAWGTLVLWAARQRHPGRRALAMCCTSWFLAGTAEVWDFAPVCGLMDAHALWHCLTPVCSWLWYVFIAADCNLWDGGGQLMRKDTA